MTERTKILIVDDEEDFCYFIKLNLENTNKFEVSISTTAEKGIELAKKNKPDLILLDVIMPVMDGTVVAQHLLDDTSTKNIPIIYLTAIARKRDVAAYDGVIGGRHFIAKPVTPDELIARIGSVLKIAQGET